jgi:hypothetical protein
MSILTDELEDLENDLDNAKKNVGTSPGPLTEPAASQVGTLLSSADVHIRAVLDELGITGTATMSFPSNLPGIAEWCRSLAEEAYESAASANPNNQLIADRMATIDRTLNVVSGYRDLAGIA